MGLSRIEADDGSVCAKVATELNNKVNNEINFFMGSQVRDSALTFDSGPSSRGFSLILRINVLSAVNTRHNSTTKNVKKMMNEITGQMATLSML